ncbi:hypothetical protein [Natronolimnohabitans innermongolicus]|uniref:Uncharacterized protein n=1 Tax=Natronolimnohabitans innermongolicus JCM 12255 TaxID=1227499 RepID=L9XJ21_9EURY|nr:hypothetical protein [Natronolimnohabitans innermongolicus]ELY60658.1 hypothetical protein C493_04256 [Natronolimnohabitans innermongolicus JCM 12255]
MSAPDTNGSPDGAPGVVKTEWLWFGVALAIAHVLFLALVVGLLQIDVVLALVVAVTLSVVAGIAITAFVLWWT